MDPLTQTIALLRPRALLWKQLEAIGDWALRFPRNEGVAFCVVAAGRCVLQVADRKPCVLGEGDFLLLTAPPAWTLGETETAVPINLDELPSGPDMRTTFLGRGRMGPVTRLLGGHFRFDGANAALLKGLLPAIVTIQFPEAGARRLRGVLDLIGDEAASDRPGRTLVLDRLLEIMLVEAIRHGAARAAEHRQGLLTGLADPQIAAALRALHADVRRRWTIAQLAAIAGMSRSVFADRFCRVVGLPPMSYLLRWRMALAKDALRFGDDPLAEIAFACGYQSVSAFSAAFSRTIGCPPSRYAAEAVRP